MLKQCIFSIDFTALQLLYAGWNDQTSLNKNNPKLLLLDETMTVCSLQMDDKISFFIELVSRIWLMMGFAQFGSSLHCTRKPDETNEFVTKTAQEMTSSRIETTGL